MARPSERRHGQRARVSESARYATRQGAPWRRARCHATPRCRAKSACALVGPVCRSVVGVPRKHPDPLFVAAGRAVRRRLEAATAVRDAPETLTRGCFSASRVRSLLPRVERAGSCGLHPLRRVLDARKGPCLAARVRKVPAWTCRATRRVARRPAALKPPLRPASCLSKPPNCFWRRRKRATDRAADAARARRARLRRRAWPCRRRCVRIPRERGAAARSACAAAFANAARGHAASDAAWRTRRPPPPTRAATPPRRRGRRRRTRCDAPRAARAPHRERVEHREVHLLVV